MENVLQEINKRFVALADAEKERNNVILHEVVDKVIAELKKGPLFKALFREKFHGGSFYDGLKVGNSTEFDIDMLLILPKNGNFKIEPSNKPGFVHVVTTGCTNMGDNYKGLENLIDPKTNRISAKKTLSWTEGLITKALSQLCPNGTPLSQKSIRGKNFKIFVRYRKAGPAFTMNVSAEAPGEKIEIDVDLVPCFQFESNFWPSKEKGYKQLDRKNHGSKGTFLAVPKLPTDVPNPDFYWRLSFQEQERELISGSELGRLKPAVRLIKKIRDHWDHKKISSYYIKTVFLWEVEKRDKTFWHKPLADVFLEMLKVYHNQLEQGNIKYFWNSKYNLIGNIKKPTLEGISNKIKNIIGDIERLGAVDPLVVAKHMVSPEELELFKKDVKIVGKVKPLQPSISSSSLFSSTVSTSCNGHVELIKKLQYENAALLKENNKLVQRNNFLEQELRKVSTERNDPAQNLIGQMVTWSLSTMMNSRNANPNN